MGIRDRIFWQLAVILLFTIAKISCQEGDTEPTPDPNENLLWCLQCTWTSQHYIPSEGNNTNTTTEPSCQVGDTQDIELFPPTRDYPLYNPICDTSKPQYYLPVLTGPCYEFACRIIDAGTCVKWTVYSPSGVLNVTRFCATSNKPYGCYEESQPDGYTKEVCNCNDQHYCNSSRQNVPHVWRSLMSLFCLYIVFYNI